METSEKTKIVSKIFKDNLLKVAAPEFVKLIPVVGDPIAKYLNKSIEDAERAIKAGEQVKIVLTEEQKKEVERIINEAREFLKKPAVYATTLVIYPYKDNQIFEELKNELRKLIDTEEIPDYKDENGEAVEKLNEAKEVINDFANNYIDWELPPEYDENYIWLRFNFHAYNSGDFVLTSELRDEVVRFIHALNVIAENFDEENVPFFVRYEIL